MVTKRNLPRSVDEYIAAFPTIVQAKLGSIRKAIAKAVPGAEETISYGIPAFARNGRVFVYFAGFAKHVSVYPAPRSVEAFKKALAPYKGGRGTVQFALDEAVPLGLVARIARFRMREIGAGARKVTAVKKARAKAKTTVKRPRRPSAG